MAKLLGSRELKAMMAAAAVAAGALLAGCPPAPAPRAKAPAVVESPAVSPDSAVRWRGFAARGQQVWVKLELPVVVGNSRVIVHAPQRDTRAPAPHNVAEPVPGAGSAATEPAATEPATLPAAAEAEPLLLESAWPGDPLEGVELFSARIVRTAVEGPGVEQLTGEPRTAADGGSYLVPVGGQAGEGVRQFQIREPMPVYLRVRVPAAVEAGEYRFGVRIEMPGRAAEEGMLAVQVSDLAVPTEPRVLGIVTTTAEKLAGIYPESFAGVATPVLDRNVPEHLEAIKRIDALMLAARREGMALFVEDLAPGVRVSEQGVLSVEWDGYDRVMGGYMEGSAFGDRIPMPVWLAPVPPRRIRDSATQLRQYMEACARHHREKGWVGQPVFMHPVMAEVNGGEGAARVAQLLKLHLPREWAAVTPVGGEALGVPQPEMWVANNGDARVPPVVGGQESSVRAWPWVCVARGGGASGVKGFVWRDGVAGVKELGEGKAPLLVASGAEIMPALRMVWVAAGMNDAALLGLLEKRSDPAMVGEVMAGMVGRAGLTEVPGMLMQVAREGDGLIWPMAERGYLYSGWPQGGQLWSQVTPMLTKLALANEPGQRVQVAGDDPVWLAAKVWLAESRKPVGRVTGWSFGVRPGRQSAIIDARAEMMVENPVAAEAEFDLKMMELPGDFELAPQAVREAGGAGSGGGRLKMVKMGPSSAQRLVVPMAGHVDALLKGGEVSRLEMTERHGGATVRLPLRMPVYRTRALTADEDAPKLDGRSNEWAVDNQLKAFGEMTVGTRYASRADLLSGSIREDAAPAMVRWVYDPEYLYVLVRCPQDAVTDERNTEWPVREKRWWGADGVQVVIGNAKRETRNAKEGEERVVVMGFKPSGVVLVKTGRLVEGRMEWTEGGPGGGGGGVKYGIGVEKREGRVTGWVVEAAIPRAWVGGKVEGVEMPAWRVNVLRHRAGDLGSMSWSGPLVDDEDVGMMGLLLGG